MRRTQATRRARIIVVCMPRYMVEQVHRYMVEQVHVGVRIGRTYWVQVYPYACMPVCLYACMHAYIIIRVGMRQMGNLNINFKSAWMPFKSAPLSRNYKSDKLYIGFKIIALRLYFTVVNSFY